MPMLGQNPAGLERGSFCAQGSATTTMKGDGRGETRRRATLPAFPCSVLGAAAACLLALLTQARAEMLEFDCSDKYGVYYNIWVDTDRSSVSLRYAHPDQSQQLRTYPAQISANAVHWSFSTSSQVSLDASIDMTTGRYVQVYGGVAKGTGSFQCRRGNKPFPGG